MASQESLSGKATRSRVGNILKLGAVKMRKIQEVLLDKQAIEEITNLSNETVTYLPNISFNFNIEKWMVVRVLKGLSNYLNENNIGRK